MKDKLADDKNMFIKIKIPTAPGSTDGEMEFRSAPFHHFTPRKPLTAPHCSLKVPMDATATQLVTMALSKKLRSDGKAKAAADAYVLKVQFT